MQAEKFGAEFAVARTAARAVDATGAPYRLERRRHLCQARRPSSSRRASSTASPTSPTSRASTASASTSARRTSRESLCAGEEVVVVGGANSAGQAAVFLAGVARRVHDARPRHRARREHVALPDPAHRGDAEHRAPHAARGSRPSRARATSSGSRGATGRRATRRRRDPARVPDDGRRPEHGLAPGCVALDAKGFVKTGPDLAAAELRGRRWPLPARPLLFETTLPGRLRGGRRPRRERQAGRGGRGRGLRLRPARPQGRWPHRAVALRAGPDPGRGPGRGCRPISAGTSPGSPSPGPR